VWLADNLLRGASPGSLRAVLLSHGVPPKVADLGVAAALRAPELEAARGHLALAEHERLGARLRRTLQALRGPEIERRNVPGPDEFLRHYYSTGTPVVFTDIVPHWPAYRRWSPEHLRTHYGHVELEIEAGRAADATPDLNFERHRGTATMAEFVERVLAAGETNDLYLIANNRNLARPGLQPLLEDIELPAGYFDPAPGRAARCGAFWFGPAGTVTALHHDTSNILFFQVLGRKRFRLYPPDEPALLTGARGVYNDLDPEHDAAVLAAVPGFDLVLAPGEALFLPIGWWHHVRALDLSISVAFNHFNWPNDFDWYRPGTPRR
jgi:ribosomal protein L16 Arg81 hydroxylase